MSIAIDILQASLRGAENQLAAADSHLNNVKKQFRAAKHSHDAAAITVAELQHAIFVLGAKPDIKNA